MSVICPVYNTPPDLLAAAVASVLAEGGDHVIELLLLDDVSTNAATVSELARLATSDSRVRVIRQRTNGGPSAARGAGLEAAKGDWIGFIDSDDLWIPGRIEATLNLLRLAPDAQWISSRIVNIMADGSRTAPPSLLNETDGERLADRIILLKGTQLTRHFISNSWLHLGSTIARKDTLLRAGGFAHNLYFHEDCFLMTKLSIITKLYFMDIETYAWRRERESLMASERRLSPAYVLMHEVARAEPLLKDFARELRWARYAAYKGLALNNLLSGRRAAAMRFALGAWSIDPREVTDLARFVRLTLTAGQNLDPSLAAAYSRAERFVRASGRAAD
ncbi:glycosyltransferase family 2 protein [Falsiroseomonas sp. E2-1-a20]|uniref:glycosyltransferase family 2 protein n=1 Tax=Falsiroseomonas sp. E2-1-a20 TaxID=3239300 RepID=UPI003F2C9DB5